VEARSAATARAATATAAINPAIEKRTRRTRSCLDVIKSEQVAIHGF
jgi:hypothetical protein